MKLFKSKAGFTLIELLVVIGILAVLAAIAIPSVAGLIDRANVSADKTNANEMTNAMERFAAEYELYRQDIASGLLKDGDGDGVPDNMDAAQGRVYNATGAVTMEDIRKLESETGLNGIRIDITSKYAQNSATAKAVMENYMKTSSSTFEPKQSDMTYWYNSVTGYTLVAGKDIDTSTLYDLLPSEIKYDNSREASVSEWIDLSANFSVPDIRIVKATKCVNDEGRIGIDFHVQIPNSKYNPNVDLEKIYVLAMNENKGDILTMQTASSKRTIWGAFPDRLKYKWLEATEEFVVTYFSMLPGSQNPDEECLFRLAYEYEEDGEVRYVYSAIFRYSYNGAISE